MWLQISPFRTEWKTSSYVSHHHKKLSSSLFASSNSEIQNSTRNLLPLVPGLHIIQLKTLARLQHNSLLSWPAFILIAKRHHMKNSLSVWSCTEILLWHTKWREVLMDLTDDIGLYELRWTNLLFVKFIIVSGTELCVIWWDYFTGWTATCGWKVANRTHTRQRLRFPKEADSERQYTMRQMCHRPMGLDKWLQNTQEPRTAQMAQTATWLATVCFLYYSQVPFCTIIH